MKDTIDVNLFWFHFSQNNSGGHFITDDNVAPDVFIQARNAEEAIDKAHDILDDSGMDWCECCGKRWSFYIDDEDGTNEPMIYGEPLSRVESSRYRRDVRLHYVCGCVEKVVLGDGKDEGRGSLRYEQDRLEQGAGRCCDGGPQWGHAFDCQTLP